MKVFRALRRRLIVQKQLRSYFLYALGEIILVVVGILIALAIDNRAEQRTLDRKEQTYLLGLNKEFQTSRKKLIQLIAINRQNYENAQRIVGFIDQPSSLPSEQVFSELLFNTLNYDIAYNPNNSLLSEMINSGSLKDLSNPELRRQLTNWIATLDDIVRQEQDLDRQRENVLDLFRSDTYSIRTILDHTDVTQVELGLSPKNTPINNLPLLQSTWFENNLLLFILSSQATESSHYAPLLEDVDSILALLKQELHTR